LRNEMENGTASEATEARFMAMLSAKGVQLQQESEKISQSLTEIADKRADIDRQLNELRKKAFPGNTRVPTQQANPQEKYRGFRNDNWGNAKVVEMSPVEYLRRMAFQFGNGDIAGLLRVASPREIERLAGYMRRGVRYDAPTLNYSGMTTANAQNVLAALINGYKRIPVLVVE